MNNNNNNCVESQLEAASEGTQVKQLGSIALVT